MKITAKAPTLLKKRPVSSTILALSDIKAVPYGKTYSVSAIEFATGGHSKITLDYGAGIWYVFNAHWSGLNAEVISKATAEHIFVMTISDVLLTDLNACLNRYEITTRQRLCHFLSQIAHESGGLLWLKEIWGDTPEQLAYEKRGDLGNIYPGDGPKFKGAGAIQLTGRSNYAALCKAIGDERIMEGCDYVAKTYPFTSAGFWWHNNDMNALCDQGATVEQVTRRVNGGTNGLSDRQRYYNRCCDVIA